MYPTHCKPQNREGEAAAMSKNTRDANFRKVDIDELDEEQFRDEAEDEYQGEDQIGQREAEVKKFTSKYPLKGFYGV